MSSTPSHRPVQDPHAIRRALAILEQTETPMEKFVREEHSAMHSAARIGMDAGRHLLPTDIHHIPDDARAAIGVALHDFEHAYAHLDAVAHLLHGDLMQSALLGHPIEGDLQAEEERLGIAPPVFGVPVPESQAEAEPPAPNPPTQAPESQG